MGTHAILTFTDSDGSFNVFQHWDGYPSGVAAHLKVLFERKLAWALPRFEADEFATAYIAAAKTDGGNIRLTKSRHAYSDVAYGYHFGMKDGTLQVKVTATDFWDKPKESTIWTGPVSDFLEIAETLE